MVVGQLEAGAVVGEAHEDVDGLVADRASGAISSKPERLVEGDGAIDVADSVAGVDELGHGPQPSLAARAGLAMYGRMVLERSMHPQFLSNTYLVRRARRRGASSSTPAAR